MSKKTRKITAVIIAVVMVGTVIASVIGMFMTPTASAAELWMPERLKVKQEFSYFLIGQVKKMPEPTPVPTQEPTPEPTLTPGERMVAVAMNECGYLEKASNHSLDEPKANPGRANFTKYGAWYGFNGVAWCNIFVSWCANEAGILGEYVPKSAACRQTWAWYEAKGLTHRVNSGYIPKPGDLVFKGPASHIEIVVKYDANGTLWTIGGNTSGQGADAEGAGVYYKSYTSPENVWYGYAELAYQQPIREGQVVMPNPTLKPISKTTKTTNTSKASKTSKGSVKTKPIQSEKPMQTVPPIETVQPSESPTDVPIQSAQPVVTIQPSESTTPTDVPNVQPVVATQQSELSTVTPARSNDSPSSAVQNQATQSKQAEIYRLDNMGKM